MQRAVAFTAATESKGLHDMTFWIGKASSVLASLLHAAALDGRTMADVYQWAHGIDDAEAERILTAHPGTAGGWLGPIREVRKPGRTADSIRMTVTRALAWLADPAVAAATSPGPDEGFDVAEFVSGRNTLYMIGAGRDEAPIAPLFRAFAEYVHDRATFVGSLQPHGRLDPPMLMALDEVTQICPVPLPSWMADSAGKGILIVAVCHGLAQLEARWDSAGARAIWDTAGIKVILGGVADPDTLDRLSRLCGEISLRTHSRSWYDDGRRARTVTYQPVRVLPPELLRGLPEWRALVIRGNLSPVVVRLRMAWRRQDYRHARRASGPFARRLPSAEVDHPWPDWPEAEVTEELVHLSPADRSWPTEDTRLDLDADPDELTNQPNSAEPQAVPPWASPPGRVPPSANPGEPRPPRPRRPWEPPVDSRDRQ